VFLVALAHGYERVVLILMSLEVLTLKPLKSIRCRGFA